MEAWLRLAYQVQIEGPASGGVGKRCARSAERRWQKFPPYHDDAQELTLSSSSMIPSSYTNRLELRPSPSARPLPIPIASSSSSSSSYGFILALFLVPTLRFVIVIPFSDMTSASEQSALPSSSSLRKAMSPTSRRKQLRWLLPLSTLAFTVTAALLILFSHASPEYSFLAGWTRQRSCPCSCPHTSSASTSPSSNNTPADTPTTDPPYLGHRTIERIFTRLPFLEPLSSSQDSAAWADEFTTPKGGFLVVRRNESYTEKWGVSVYHSLHCLQLLRGALGKTLISTTKLGMNSQHGGDGKHGDALHRSRGDDGAGDSSEHSAHTEDAEHLEHCVSYIAQVSPFNVSAAQCNARKRGA